MEYVSVGATIKEVCRIAFIREFDVYNLLQVNWDLAIGNPGCNQHGYQGWRSAYAVRRAPYVILFCFTIIRKDTDQKVSDSVVMHSPDPLEERPTNMFGFGANSEGGLSYGSAA